VFFFDLGVVRVDDSFKYPIPRFGYPPMNRPQHVFVSSSNQDFAYTPSNPTTQSVDSMTWSATDQLNRRPSLSQYSNRYERHAKDNFPYWPTDVSYKKPRCKIDRFVYVLIHTIIYILGRTGTTGTFKTALGLSDSILKL
jgi:hypothetical protein